MNEITPFRVSIGDINNGYPCPECGAVLMLINATATRSPGAWCPSCHHVWQLLDEVDLGDLDDLDESDPGVR